MYYFETNALRILANQLNMTDILENSYSSILSICEIFSGIQDEKTFNQRKGIFKKVLLSKIKIDLDLPETKFYKSYGIELSSQVSTNIMAIGDILINSNSYLDFSQKINSYKMGEYWDFLKVYDRNGDIKFKESFKNRQAKFDYSDKHMISDFNTRWNNINTAPNLRNEILKDLIKYFANTLLASNSVIKMGNRTLADLVNMYDNSININLLCVAYYSGTKLVFKDAPSKNDFFDLNHLMYLNNKFDSIVSNDTMLTKLMKKICPANIISTEDFMIKIRSVIPLR